MTPMVKSTGRVRPSGTRRYLVGAALSALWALAACTSVPGESDADLVESEFVVMLDEGYDLGALAEIWSAIDPTIEVLGPPSNGLIKVIARSDLSTEEILSVLSAPPSVQAAQVNARREPLGEQPLSLDGVELPPEN